MLNWFEPKLMQILPQLLLLLGLALVISSIGYYRVVYFISIGYAFAIVAMAVITPFQYLENLTWLSILQNIFLIIWGARLGIFVIQRESRTSYSAVKTSTEQITARLSIGIKFLIWVSVSVLYVFMYSPSLFNLMMGPANLSWGHYVAQLIGLLLMGGGLVIEGLSDKQKSNYKAHFPNQNCDTGLYRWVRYPNYLGEIMVWVGNWVVGLMIYDTPLKWFISLIGVVILVLIMLGSAKRLEKNQNERYGEQSKYQTYIRNVPVLFPWAKIYSLQNLRVYLDW